MKGARGQLRGLRRRTVRACLLTLVLCAGGGLSAVGDNVTLSHIDSGTTSPTAQYRWLDVADQAYASSIRSSYSYTQASVQVSFDPVADVLSGTLTATDLKPNFAYQLKLLGTPGTASNERIGLAGRWWQETWDGSAWSGGTNLNDKGDGSSPNPNDLVYFSTRDVPDATSPTSRHYRYSAYFVLDYFITDETGSASPNFRADSSYHVLWKTTQQAHSAQDGPLETALFDPDPSQAAYGIDYPASTVSIFGEWERLPVSGVFLASGEYACQVLLTEESFHGSGGTLAGSWAGAMSAGLAFTILSVPGDANFDGLVDSADLAIWQQNYDPLGRNANTFGMADWDLNRVVDSADLALWQRHYSPLNVSPAAAVPEPRTFLLLAAGSLSLGLTSRPRRRSRPTASVRRAAPRPCSGQLGPRYFNSDSIASMTRARSLSHTFIGFTSRSLPASKSSISS